MSENDRVLINASGQLLKAVLYTVDTVGCIPEEKLTPDLKAIHYYNVRAIKKITKTYPKNELPYKVYSTQGVCNMLNIHRGLLQKLKYEGLGPKPITLWGVTKPLYTYESIVEWLSGLGGEYPKDPYMWLEFKMKAERFLSTEL
ncbi:hypothetical protein KAR91_01330 [Candidatus Pacearchaeota archaeon]|nr:hypothetical protein [Candidatus Pacearchaeota archaeon]